MLLLVTIYTVMRGAYHNRAPGEGFWTYVVLGYVAVNLVTIFVYCLDKGLAVRDGAIRSEDDVWRPSRLPESFLLMLEWAGGMLVAFPLRLAIRHKVGRKRFGRATVAFFLGHALFWLVWWRVQQLPADVLAHHVFAYFNLVLLFAATAPAAMCLDKHDSELVSLKCVAGMAAILGIISFSVGINPIPYLRGEIPESGTKAGQPQLLMPSYDPVEIPASQ